jgi:cellulose synthase operon protein C
MNSSNGLAVVLLTLVLAACGSQTPEDWIASAKQRLDKGENSAAIIELKNAIQKDPKLAEARLLLGTAMLDTGDLNGAEIELRRALDLGAPKKLVDPPLARAMLLKGQYKQVITSYANYDAPGPSLLTSVGQAQLAVGQIDDAARAFTAALALQGDYAPAILGKARLQAVKRDLPGAIALARQAIDASPRSIEAHGVLAELLWVEGKPDQALASYRQVLQIGPRNLPAHVAIISILFQQNKLDEAGKQLDALNRFAPKHPETLYFKTYQAYLRKDLDAARQNAALHLNAAPNSVRGLLLASAVEQEAKAFQQSESYLNQALAKAPGFAPAQRALIGSYLRSGQREKAIEALGPMLKANANDPTTLALAGEAYFVSGRPSEAASYFAKATELNPKDSKTVTGLALSHLAQGMTDQGLKELEQAATMSTDKRADLALIVALIKRREFDKAQTAVDAMEREAVGQATAVSHYLRGIVLLGKRQPDLAKASFEKAMAIDPAYFPGAVQLARLDLIERKPESAEKRLEGVLAKNPKSVEALLALAHIKSGRRAKPEEVVALMNRAIALAPTAAAPKLALINYYLTTNEPAKAVAAGQEALAAARDQPELLEATGRAQLASGSSEQAIATFQRLVKVQPKAALPLLRLAEAQLAGKDLVAAEATLKRALKLKPDYLDAQRRLIALQIAKGQTTEALAVARDIKTQRPSESAGYALEGDIHGFRKDLKAAVSAYDAGLKRVGSVDLAMKKHAALRAAGNQKEADLVASEWQKAHPNDTRFRVYQAEAAIALGRYQEAVTLYQALVALDPNNPAWVNNLAHSAAQIKDPKALEYAERAFRLAPENPAIMHTLGEVLVEQGDAKRGVELMRKAASGAPNRPALRLSLAKGLMKVGQKDEAKRELESLAKLGDKFPAQAEVSQLLRGL